MEGSDLEEHAAELLGEFSEEVEGGCVGCGRAELAGGGRKTEIAGAGTVADLQMQFRSVGIRPKGECTIMGRCGRRKVGLDEWVFDVR